MTAATFIMTVTATAIGFAFGWYARRPRKKTASHMSQHEGREALDTIRRMIEHLWRGDLETGVLVAYRLCDLMGTKSDDRVVLHILNMALADIRKPAMSMDDLHISQQVLVRRGFISEVR